IFPWGEASITLEDMIFSGGFSAVGNSILNPLRGDELKGTEEQLRKARKEIANTTNTKKPGQDAWMKEFMNSGSKLEHEAFLIVWLSRFVFPTKHEIIRKNVFPTAIQLARGIRIALAPAVLASIYRDLGLLKERIVNSSKPGSSEDENLMILSPFQCVQIWAWERIIELQPLPNSLKPGEPRLAQWHQKGLAPGLDDIRSVLDSARENFRWRPYTKPLKNLSLPKFYVEKDSWVSIDPSSDRGVVSLARCLRVSRLIGFGCLQPYFPHRVSLQFGYDQDLPGIVPESIQTPETAWKDYAKPITVGFLYVPSRYSEADFTVRYLKWWRQSVLTLQAENKQDSQQQSTRTKTSKAVKFAPTKKDPRNRSRPIKGYQETSE
ncbi:uncharacterized protein LOC110824453, partial [Carica papaya]|uniref:uncharacterized protein LOC110824453 n=1 Tax=Carica papaya TaxID=3649 RepID=UPI000B8CD58A